MCNKNKRWTDISRLTPDFGKSVASALIVLSSISSYEFASAQTQAVAPNSVRSTQCSRPPVRPQTGRSRLTKAGTHNLFNGLRIPLPGLQKMQAGRVFAIAPMASPNPRTACPGDRFALPVLTRGSSQFGSSGSSTIMHGGSYFEAQITQVARPARDSSDGAISFVINYFVRPAPGGREIAVPVVASMHAEPDLDMYEESVMSDQLERWGAAIGQMTGGVDGFFNLGQFGFLLGKAFDGRVQRRSSFIAGQLSPATQAIPYILIDQTTHF